MSNFFKIILTGIILVIFIALSYYYHAVLKTDIVVSHFYYGLIVVTSFWWGRISIGIAVLLSFGLLLTHYLSGQYFNNIYPDIIRSTMLFLVAVTVSVLQDKIRKSEQRFIEFSRKILHLREEEKKRTAIDLHDELGAMAVSVHSHLNILEEELQNNDTKNALKQLRQGRETLRKSIVNLKRLIVDLRPPDLDMIGLEEILRHHCAEISSHASIKINLHTDLPAKNLRTDVSIVVYRIIQEALNNIVKHACATTVDIHLSLVNDLLKLLISDNGQGFNPAQVFDHNPYLKIGLEGMRQRAAALGGNFHIESRTGNGCTIRVIIPHPLAPELADDGEKHINRYR